MLVGSAPGTHLFPRLWLFLWWEGGGVWTSWTPTEASGQVGRRLYLTEAETSDRPGTAQRDCVEPRHTLGAPNRLCVYSM